MAKTIEDLIVKLKAEGFENIDKLRGSFRELSKVTFSTETQIQRTRKELFDFARAAGNTDSVTKGLIDALRGLRAQADFCGASYGQLTTDLRRLNEVQQGATNSLLAQRNALVSTFSETARVVRVLQDHREALVALQTQTRQNSSAFNTLANDIAAIDGRIQESTQIIGQYRRALTTGLPATEAGARQRLQTLQAGIDLQRETIQLIDEGTGAERRANAARKAEAAAELANLRQQQRQLIFQESARSGRLAVRTAAAAFNAPDLTEGFLAPSAMGGRGGVGEFAMPNTTAALNQELGELRERLNNTILSTENYNNVAVRMAAIQRELRDASAGVAAALYREFARGDIPPAVANLTQLLSALRTSQAALNTRTTEGAEAFRLYEMQARALERQLQQVREQQQGLAAAPITSGFRAFSREATTRTAATAAEAEAALARSIARGRRKHGILSPEDAEQVTATVNALSRAEIDASNAVRIATDRNAALWLKTQQLKNEHADRLNTELIASNDRVFQAELSQFDTLLAARNRYEVGRQVSKQYLGLGGRDLSSFYEQVVGLGVGTAGTTASKYQGRDFSRVLADTVDAFNLQLTESSRTAVEGMGLFKEAAIAHAGGSKKVREVLDKYKESAIPANMYPFAGESGKDYERRITGGASIFKQATELFSRILGGAGTAINTSADSIRDSAIRFADEAGRAPEVATRLGKYGASGNIPMYMLPGTKESPEAYTARILGDPKQVIPSLGDVKQSTISKLHETRDLLEQIRADIPPIGRDAAEVSRVVEQNLNKIDVELYRRQRIQSRRSPLSGMQLAQGVGAALSGGIFGGPEGLIGGLGGLAIGGVGGSFAGAAFGAQVGMFRQQLGVVTEYSARIDKLQIALRGIVGSQDAYKQALAAAASVTRDLNIPQEVAIQGMTRLSAAVKGAGGNVSDSAFAFRAINEAVKATGGNAEQADGALLALTQVFSKGKVSAEELNQIAERLPGTFTLFAEAAGMTGPQLQKALQEGQVGLNDLMKFLQLISSQYGQTALKIAASSQDAGARLSVAMKQMQLDVGRALQPIGAQLQDAFAKFIASTTPAIIIAAKLTSAAIGGIYTVISSGLKLLVSMRGLLDNLSKAMLVFGGITAGVFVASNITTFTSALKGVLVVLRTMLSVEKALLVVENARIAAQTILAGLTAGATRGKILGAILGGAAGVGAVIGIGKLVEGVVKDIESGLANTLKDSEFKVPALSKFALPSTSSAKEAKDAERERQAAAEEAIRQQTSINRLLQEQLRLNYEAGTIDADKLSKLDAEEYLLKQIVRLRLNEVNLTSKTQKERQLGVINVNTDFKRELARIKKERGDVLNEIKDLGKDVKKEWSDLTGEFIQESPLEVGLRRFEEARVSFIEKRDIELKALRERVGMRPEGASARTALGNAKAAAAEISPAQATAIVSKQILQSDIEALQRDIRTLESGANTMGTLGEIMDKHRSYWQDLDAGQRQYIANLAEIKDSLRFMQDSRIGVGFREGAQAYVQSIGTMREATSQLAQTGIKGVEDAIFSLVTTGTANFRDFAKQILENTARMIIQQLILRTVMQAIGAIGGGGGSALAKTFEMPGAGFPTSGFKFANGGAFASNGIVPFAMGGVVNRPTMFAFANGGVGRLGLMGEAGPEAIMPLRRLPSGRLGIESTGGGAPVTVNVSVDATGSQVQGDAGQASQLARVVAGAVQAELIKQKRPGGILSS